MTDQAPTLMAAVWIDPEFLAEIDAGAATAFNWTRESIAGWGLTIAGKTFHAEGRREGVVHLGQDGGRESRHVGRWEVF